MLISIVKLMKYITMSILLNKLSGLGFIEYWDKKRSGRESQKGRDRERQNARASEAEEKQH